MRLVLFNIREPLPGQVLPEMVEVAGPDEAARRYRAIVVTTLRQLRGLSDARLRLRVSPDEACEAVRFWILPRLADKWLARGEVFLADGWEIDFGGDEDHFTTVASGEILCPGLGSRWVHTALLGLGNTIREVIGPAANGGEYLRAKAGSPTVLTENAPVRILPELPVVRNSADWEQALESLLGPALKRAWEEER